MISHLTGRLAENATSVITATGVGYAIICPQPPGTDGDEVSLWVHHQRSDNTDVLYGFTTTADRDLFQALIRCPGVGGRTACDILAAGTAAATAALRNGNTTWLAGIKGVGPAKAKRIVAVVKVPDHLVSDTTTPADTPPDQRSELIAAVMAATGCDATTAQDAVAAAGEGDERSILTAAIRHAARSRT